MNAIQKAEQQPVPAATHKAVEDIDGLIVWQVKHVAAKCGLSISYIRDLVEANRLKPIERQKWTQILFNPAHVREQALAGFPVIDSEK